MGMINKFCLACFRSSFFLILLISQLICCCFSGCKTDNQNCDSIINRDIVSRTELELGLNCISKPTNKGKREIRIWLFTESTGHQQLLIIPFQGRYKNYLYNSSLGIEHGVTDFVIDSIRMESAIIDSTIWKNLSLLISDTNSLKYYNRENGIYAWHCVFEIFYDDSFRAFEVKYRGYNNNLYDNTVQKNLFDFLKNKFNFPNDQSLMF